MLQISDGFYFLVFAISIEPNLMKTFLVAMLLFLLCLIWPSSTMDLAIEGFEKTDSESISLDPTKIISLSWRPRAFLDKNFLTDAECNHIISLAKNRLTRSTVGKLVKSNIRTSSGTFLFRAQDKIVKHVEDKIAAWTFLPAKNGEKLQVLKYKQGQKYEPHFDYFHDKNNQPPGGDRVATVLMYLSDVIEGGETVFPSAEDRRTFKDASSTECGRRGGAVKPRKGDALLFYNLHPNSTLDKASLHRGCPILAGEKWSATKWLHVSSVLRGSQDCVDHNEMCGDWGLHGECEKNQAYMVSSKSHLGSCRKSCKVC